VLAHRASRVGASAWVALGAATSLLITSFDGAALFVRLLSCVGVAAIIWLRIEGRFQGCIRRLANASVLAVALYIVTTVATLQLAERQVAAWLAVRKSVPIEIMAGPAPGNSFLRDVVVVDAEHYHFLEVDWLAAESVRLTHPPIERGREGPITRLRFPRLKSGVRTAGDAFRPIEFSERRTAIRYRSLTSVLRGVPVADLEPPSWNWVGTCVSSPADPVVSRA